MASHSVPSPTRLDGLLYGLAAYGLWGAAPLYFSSLAQATGNTISAGEILAHRIVWSVVLLALLLTLTRRWPLLARCLRHRAIAWMLVASAILVGLNWYVYIYGITHQQVIQTSLGYFINPLANVLLGMVFFRERLRRLQWIAVGLATAGVITLTLAVGELPWIALSLASLFSLYGLLRKIAPVDGLVGLSFETFLLAPLAGGYLLWLGSDGTLGTCGMLADVLILCSGVVTALPLMCFGQAARRLRLSTMGFLQYLSPSLQFVCAVAVLGEPFTDTDLWCFGCIWTGLALFAVDSVLRLRRSVSC
jgi:chloramphenicol-sensitive protein RarD